MSEALDPLTLLELWDMFVLYAAGFAMGRQSAPRRPPSSPGDT